MPGKFRLRSMKQSAYSTRLIDSYSVLNKLSGTLQSLQLDVRVRLI
jgi:hypothetical protein